jgi:hypothetical protein
MSIGRPRGMGAASEGLRAIHRELRPLLPRSTVCDNNARRHHRRHLDVVTHQHLEVALLVVLLRLPAADRARVRPCSKGATELLEGLLAGALAALANAVVKPGVAHHRRNP